MPLCCWVLRAVGAEGYRTTIAVVGPAGTAGAGAEQRTLGNCAIAAERSRAFGEVTPHGESRTFSVRPCHAGGLVPCAGRVWAE